MAGIRISLFLFPILLVLLLVPCVFALGITPAKVEATYSPGSPQTFIFSILNNRGAANIQVGNDLARFVTEKKVYPDERGNWFAEVTFTHDASLSPGQHELEVIIGEEPKQEYGQPAMMGAQVQIGGRIILFAPSDNKFLQFKDFEWVKRANHGVNGYYKVTVENLGKEVIESLSGKLHVTSQSNPAFSVDIPLTSMNGLGYQQKADLRGEWMPGVDVPFGAYDIGPEISWDGQVLKVPPYSFTVGDMLINVTSMTPTEFEVNKITSASISVASFWSSPINYVMTGSITTPDGVEVKKLSSTPGSVRLFTEEASTVYVDTNNVALGDYKLNVDLAYEGKKTSYSVPIKVIAQKVAVVEAVPVSDVTALDGAESSSNSTYYYVGGGVMLLLLLFFIFFKRRQDNSDEV